MHRSIEKYSYAAFRAAGVQRVNKSETTCDGKENICEFTEFVGDIGRLQKAFGLKLHEG